MSCRMERRVVTSMIKWINDKIITSRLSEYPACDHLNVAIRLLLSETAEKETAIKEICYAISKSDGYFYDDIKEELKRRSIWG